MPATSPETAILVFAKAPLAGSVKTRLIPLLGAEGAAALHLQLLDHALATARDAATGPLQLWCAPDPAHPALQAAAAAHRATLHLQQGPDLGARMAHAFSNSLRVHRHALCIGVDCPALTPQHLRDARGALRDGHDAVFVPAEDGGYALAGLSCAAPELFEGIAWGGSQVMAQTRDRLRAAQLRWHELETLWDVDRPEDLQRLRTSGWPCV